MADGRVWMVDNLDIEIPDSFCQQDDVERCNTYGRLYTWEAAHISCKQLGKGWRLPTNEEWENLIEQYGGLVSESEEKGRMAFKNLIVGGEAEFNALLGGNREASGSYERLEAHGFYWTSSEHNAAEAWFYNFAASRKIVNRHTGDKRRAASVRCIWQAE